MSYEMYMAGVAVLIAGVSLGGAGVYEIIREWRNAKECAKFRRSIYWSMHGRYPE